MKCTHEIVGTHGGALFPDGASGACSGSKIPRVYRPQRNVIMLICDKHASLVWGWGVGRGTQIVCLFVLVNFLLNCSCFLMELDPFTCSLFYEPLHLKNVYNNLTNGSL